MKWILAVGMAVAATSLAPTVGLAAAGPVSASSAKVTQEPPGDFCGKVSDTGARALLAQLKVCPGGVTRSDRGFRAPMSGGLESPPYLSLRLNL
jgi:hypothetical protein